jgi:hypothetical protein
VETLSEQLNTRDAALLTWIGVLLVAAFWSLVRGGSIGQNLMGVGKAFVAPRILGLVAAVAAWLIAVVYLAARLSLWDPNMLKDTVVIVLVGAVMTGIKALALMRDEGRMRHEVRSIVGLVVVIQFVANLRTFPYVAELALIPLAVLLGGVQAVANHDEEHKEIRPVIDGAIVLLGLGIFAWSLFKVLSTIGHTQWQTVGRSFALAFWLPAAVLPAIYVAALVMQYGTTISRIKVVKRPTIGARADLYLHSGVSLRRLNAFAHSRGSTHDYARAKSRAERLAILRSTQPPTQ